jgi:hypothetical protein
MDTIGTTRKLVVLLVLACSASGRSAEPNDPNLQLTFGHSAEPIAWKSRELTDKPIIRPSHAARLLLVYYFLERDQVEDSMPKASDLLKTRAAKSMSELQREFLGAEGPVLLRQMSLGGGYTSQIGRYSWGKLRIDLFAVSEADAKAMVRAFMEVVLEKAELRAQPLMDEHITKLQKAKTELEQKAEEARQRLEAFPDSEPGHAEERYKEALRRSAYSLYPAEEAHMEVKKTIFELDKMLDVVDVEIAGLKAKISAIERYAGEKDVANSPALSAKLREMAIQENVELVGAETRRRVILGLKEKQQELYGLYNRWQEAESQIDTVRYELRSAMNKLRDIEQEFSDLGPDARALQIKEPHVRIHTVHQVPSAK